MDAVRSKLHRCFYVDYILLREAMAEFLGTTFLLALGDGCVAQSVLSRETKGAFLSINIGWGLAVAFAVYISGGVSGGHLNPAISLAMFLLGRISLLRLVVYSLAQYLGAIFGAAIVYAVYYDALREFDGGIRQVHGANATAGIFATYPQSFLSIGGGLGDQIVGTSALSVSVLAVSDQQNMAVPKGLAPLLVGLVVLLIGISYGFNCGYAINPARDLGPRIFTAFAGWGAQVFQFRNYCWFWIPVVGPYLGAVVGAFVYLLAVGNHWAEPAPETASHHSSLDVNLSANNDAGRGALKISEQTRL